VPSLASVSQNRLRRRMRREWHGTMRSSCRRRVGEYFRRGKVAAAAGAGREMIAKKAAARRRGRRRGGHGNGRMRSSSLDPPLAAEARRGLQSTPLLSHATHCAMLSLCHATPVGPRHCGSGAPIGHDITDEPHRGRLPDWSVHSTGRASTAVLTRRIERAPRCSLDPSSGGSERGSERGKGGASKRTD